MSITTDFSTTTAIPLPRGFEHPRDTIEYSLEHFDMVVPQTLSHRCGKAFSVKDQLVVALEIVAEQAACLKKFMAYDAAMTDWAETWLGGNDEAMNDLSARLVGCDDD